MLKVVQRLLAEVGECDRDLDGCFGIAAVEIRRREYAGFRGGVVGFAEEYVQGVQERGLARPVWADEAGIVVESHVTALDTAQVLYGYAFDLHVRPRMRIRNATDHT
jgi:hypothetical protein